MKSSNVLLEFCNNVNNVIYHLQNVNVFITIYLSDALLSPRSYIWNSLADNDICLREDGNSSLQQCQ